jgi:hypothetical protein
MEGRLSLDIILQGGSRKMQETRCFAVSFYPFALMSQRSNFLKRTNHYLATGNRSP